MLPVVMALLKELSSGHLPLVRFVAEDAVGVSVGVHDVQPGPEKGEQADVGAVIAVHPVHNGGEENEQQPHAHIGRSLRNWYGCGSET
ncbi:MAG: hypothetical protein OEU35_08900 [Desulfuromonadales bacterium]|nr:hypothetical protein [Desulfuromonadales bacterium]